MKKKICQTVFTAITLGFFLLCSCSAIKKDSGPPEGFEYGKPFRAIDNYCAWPNLTLLHDGSIIATVYNKPAHGTLPGDVECWGSVDGGWTWEYRGTPARGGETSNRMNNVAGLAKNGDLLVLSSGWQDPGEFTRLMPTLVCRSHDGGYTWEIEEGRFPTDSSGSEIVPFGDIHITGDGGLMTTAYRDKTYAVKSDDDGHTWYLLSCISSSINETAPLHLGKGNWLAAGRTRVPYPAGSVDLFVSGDDGISWEFNQHVSDTGQHPGHLMRLSDNRILLSCGDRYEGRKGVMGRISHDNGKSWGDPFRILDMEVDGRNEIGYPSSVQNSEGNVVTAFYSDMDGFHMGVVVWEPPPLTNSE
jgi:hypothetical protein